MRSRAVWTGAFAVGRCARCGPGVEPPARQGCARTHRPTRFCSRTVCVYTRVHVAECSGTCVPGTVVGGLACQQPPCLPGTCFELWKPRARSQGKSPRAVGEKKDLTASPRCPASPSGLLQACGWWEKPVEQPLELEGAQVTAFASVSPRRPSSASPSSGSVFTLGPLSQELKGGSLMAHPGVPAAHQDGYAVCALRATQGPPPHSCPNAAHPWGGGLARSCRWPATSPLASGSSRMRFY